MLNIVSRSASTPNIGGQIKVFRNLVAGLDRIGYPYVVNRRLDAAEFLWVHDDVRALPLLASLPREIKIIVGPNLYVMPRDMPPSLDLRRVLYLHPSRWACDFWIEQGFDKCQLEPWPVGIDTETFAPSSVDQRTRVLVYHKHRSPAEMGVIRSTLKRLGLEHDTIVAGSYKQSEYLVALSRAKYIIWHGRHESQGIALQEGMASGVPLLLWDVTSLAQFWTGGGGCYQFTDKERRFAVTAAPYFDERCGIRITSVEELESAIQRMERDWPTFVPRDYVIQNLSVEKQARELISRFEHYWPGSNPWKRTPVLRDGSWRPPMTWIYGAIKGRLRARLDSIYRRLGRAEPT